MLPCFLIVLLVFRVFKMSVIVFFVFHSLAVFIGLKSSWCFSLCLIVYFLKLIPFVFQSFNWFHCFCLLLFLVSLFFVVFNRFIHQKLFLIVSNCFLLLFIVFAVCYCFWLSGIAFILLVFVVLQWFTLFLIVFGCILSFCFFTCLLLSSNVFNCFFARFYLLWLVFNVPYCFVLSSSFLKMLVSIIFFSFLVDLKVLYVSNVFNCF